MNMQMTAHVCGATRYDFEGRKGATVIMLSEMDGSDNDRVGLAFSEASASFGVVDQIRDLNVTLPCNLDCEVEMRTVRNRQGKTLPTMYITSVKLPIGAAGRHQQTKADAPKVQG